MSIRSAAVVLAALLTIATTGCASRVTGTAAPVAGSAATSSAPATGAPATGGATAAPVAPGAGPAPTPAGTAPESARQDVVLVDMGFTVWNEPYLGTRFSYAATVRNPNPTTWFAQAVDVTFTFTDASGKVVATDDLATAYGVPPGATAAVVGGVGFNGDEKGVATKMAAKINKIDWFDTDILTPGSLIYGPAATRPESRPGDDTPGLIVDCPVTSTYASVTSNFFVNVIYRDAAGKIIGGGGFNTDVDGNSLKVPGRSMASLQLHDSFPPPAGVPVAECYADNLPAL